MIHWFTFSQTTDVLLVIIDNYTNLNPTNEVWQSFRNEDKQSKYQVISFFQMKNHPNIKNKKTIILKRKLNLNITA